MNKYSFFCAIMIALLMPITYAMESENPITPNGFTKAGKEYMTYSLGLWVEAAEKEGITTGLAAIMENIQKDGIDHLINDSQALKDANKGLDAMLSDPVFQTLRDLQKIDTYKYDGAKQLCADISRVITQAVATNILEITCPDVKTPSTNLIASFASQGPESIPDCIQMLKLNAHLDVVENAPYVGALTLIMGYLAQTGLGR